MIDFKELIKAGVHFGHQTARWEPKMKPYIWGYRQGVHLIDVSKTAHQLEKASKFLEEIASQGKPIFWVGTKKSAQQIIQQVGQSLNMPYVTHRWVGGSLTNYAQVKKAVTKLLHYEDVLSKSADFHYTKKELNTFQKMVDRLRKCVGGISKLTWPVGAVVIVDVKKEQTALKEAIASRIPVVALVDTNSDPSGVTYVIPANDDSPKSIGCIIAYLSGAAQRGKATAKGQDVHELEQVDETKQLLEKLTEETDEEAADRKGSKRTVKSTVRKPDDFDHKEIKKGPSKPTKIKTPSIKSSSPSRKTPSIQAKGTKSSTNKIKLS